MIVERRQLVATLQEAKRVRRTNSVEVLRCALMDVKGDEARLDVTDMETYASLGFPPAEHHHGWIKGLVEVDRALELVKSLNYRTVWLGQSKEGHILISSGVKGSKAPVQLLGGMAHPVEDWPKRPEPGQTEAAFSILPEDLRRAYEAVYRAVSKDESRPALASVQVAVNGDVSFHGCDSYRLHIMEADATAMMDGNLLIPRKAIDLVVKHTKGRTKPVLFERSGPFIRVAFGQGDDEWMLRACESQYPDVQKLVPDAKSLQVAAVADRRVFLDAVKQAEALLEAKTDPVVFALGMEHILLPVAKFEIAAEVTGGPDPTIRFGLNGAFLRMALESLSCEKVTLRFNVPTRPVLILGQTTADPRILLMPIRLSEQYAPAPPAPKPQAKQKPVDDEAREAFQEAAVAYIKTLSLGRDRYAAAYVSYMIGSRKTAPKRDDLPPRQAFNTRSKLRALAQQATYVPAQGVPDHEDEVR